MNVAPDESTNAASEESTHAADEVNAVCRDLMEYVCGSRGDEVGVPGGGGGSRRFRRLFECSHDAILFTEPDGRFSDVNPAAVALLQYAPRELQGLTLTDLVVEHDGGGTPLADLDSFREVKATLKRRDGALVEAAVSVGAWGTRQEGKVVVVRDITQTLALEQQMLQAQKMEAVGRLAGGVAHDFNNLLTAITGYAELLIQNLSPSDPIIQDAYEIRRAALSAARLTRHLLAFSRKEHTRLEVVDVNVIVGRTTGILKRTLGTDIELTLRLEPALRLVKANPSQLEQVVLNLAVNARDAMPSGGRLVVTTSMHVCRQHAWCHHRIGGEYVRLTISDTGCGIPESIRSKIFEPFFTTKGESGTGLGLATVYSIVQHAGGDVRAESDGHRGSTFTIDLPATDEQAPATDQEGHPRLVEGCASVLVVEDDSRVRELVELVLRRAGYDVIAVSTPPDALATLSSQPDIHLMLTDVVLPQMNGYDLAEEARKVAPGVRVAFMSGFANDVLHRPVAEPFIPKPFTVESLTSAVRKALDADAPGPTG
jgi:hypothetical protein